MGTMVEHHRQDGRQVARLGVLPAPASQEVEGHADEQGTREYNIALSARRAASVQDFLISQGVAAARMKTIPYGKERPIEVCSSEECYAKNRRAVTVLSMGAGA